MLNLNLVMDDTKKQVLFNIFKAYDVRGKVGTELTNDLAKKIGLAFGGWLTESGPVVVGYDMRPDSKELAENLIAGLNLSGRDTIEIGMVTSDMAVFAIKHLDASGAAIVTASHNPGEYNGIKLYDAEPKTIGLDQGLDTIRDLSLSAELEQRYISADKGSRTSQNIDEAWVDFCLKFVDLNSFKPIKIVIDAGNGMAGKILPTLLKRLPFDADELYFEPDGTFPNHPANPQVLSNLEDLISTIRESEAYLGIAFDGDGDRMAMVDENGSPITGSEMMSLLASKYLGSPEPKFVYEVRTSQVVASKLKSKGYEGIISKAGRSNIGAVMRREDAIFGGETTGHFFFKDYWFNDSGLISMLVALEQIFKVGGGITPVSKIIASEHSTGFMIPETNFELEDKFRVIKAIEDAFPNAKVDRLDVLTLNFPSGAWLNLRPSNTEPLLRLNAEAPTEEELKELVSRVEQIIEQESKS
jgi:phosphomannomutase